MYEISLVVSSFNQCWVGKNHHFQLVKWFRSKLELIFKPKLELKSEFCCSFFAELDQEPSSPVQFYFGGETGTRARTSFLKTNMG
jgi:hypothetical protein